MSNGMLKPHKLTAPSVVLQKSEPEPTDTTTRNKISRSPLPESIPVSRAAPRADSQGMSAKKGADSVVSGVKPGVVLGDAGDSMEIMRRRCLKRGVSNLKCFSAAFRQFDKDYSKEINFNEFRSGLESFQIKLSAESQRELFNRFDKDRSGSIDFQEFADNLTPPLEGRRLQIVKSVFKKLDESGDGVLKTEDLIVKFEKRARKHPKFVSGEWTVDDVITNMLAAFEQPDSTDGQVSMDEFIKYYSIVSAWVEEDSFFEANLKACWELD